MKEIKEFLFLIPDSVGSNINNTTFTTIDKLEINKEERIERIINIIK